MKQWECVFCTEAVSERGAFAKLSGTRYAHLNCYAQESVEAAQRDKNAAAQEAAEQAQAVAAQKAATLASVDGAIRAELTTLRASSIWAPEDRKQLVAAKMICVHCGTNLNTGGLPGVAPAGPARMHCSPCYVAREYGEQAAAQASAKSAAGIASVTATLAGTPPAPTPAPVAQEPAKKQDRFQLIDLE